VKTSGAHGAADRMQGPGRYENMSSSPFPHILRKNQEEVARKSKKS
jgi:hypothetical protein